MTLRHHLMPILLVLCAAVASTQETATVTGAATYRERIALPQNAVFEATLEDVSRAGAASTVIGQTRIEKPGQPPFQFSIQYDPTRIVQSGAYSVRARVTAGGKLLFTTDQAHLVLTRGRGNKVPMMIMRRAGGSSTGPLGALPASFTGDLPCADCPGIRYALNLFPDKSFYLRMTYSGRGEGKSFDDLGRWSLSPEGRILTLQGGRDSSERFALVSSDVLRKLDSQGKEIQSKLNYDLRRTATFERLDPRLSMRGMFRYMADAATFTECQSGQRWPVAMEGEYRAVEAAYLKTRRQPGDELLVTVEGRVGMRPNPDTGQPGRMLVVERYVGVWPRETCGAPYATSPLQETNWILTRLEGKPVILVQNQPEPRLVFRSEQSRLTGFGGCNNLTGGYVLNGPALTFQGVAATRRACIQGMDTEGAFLRILNRVRGWKIYGEHLELYDAAGKMLARFESRPLK